MHFGFVIYGFMSIYVLTYTLVILSGFDNFLSVVKSCLLFHIYPRVLDSMYHTYFYDKGKNLYKSVSFISYFSYVHKF